MIETENNRRATVALKSLFNGVDGGVADVKPIRERLSKATLHNYVSQVSVAGFVKAVKDDPSDKRLTSKLILTDKGKQVLEIASGKPSILPKPASANTDRNTGDIVTLDESTKVTDAFNRQSKTWKWVLVRRDTPM